MFASSEVLGTSAVMCVSLGQRPFHMLMAQRLCGVVRPSCHGKLVAKGVGPGTFTESEV